MAHSSRGHAAAAAVALLVIVVAACGRADNRGPDRRPGGVPVGVEVPATPTVSSQLPVTPASFPFLASDHDSTVIDLADHGYVEQEYLISGGASVYSWPSLTTLVRRASGPYTTRILIRRPADPARFSGSVRVEPLNPTSGHDLDATWEIAHTGLMEAGDAYVGITVSPATLAALRRFDPARYATLAMDSPLPAGLGCSPPPGKHAAGGESGLAWDIISQVGLLIKTDSPANPLRDLHPRISVLTGWSQSGSYDMTYMDAIARHVHLPDGAPIFDGFAPGAGSYAGTPISQCAPLPPAGDPRARYNPPAGVPVIALATPTDFFTAASFNRRTDRPADSDTPMRRIRLYEIGGGCHLPADQGAFFPGADEIGRAGFSPEARTAYPLSTFPLHVVLDAAFANLDTWISHGVAPPHAARLVPQTSAAAPAAWPVTPVLDRFGNPTGGVRTPTVDVPTATYTARGLRAPHSNNSAYAGYDIPFSTGYLRALYPTHAVYVQKVSADVSQLLSERWLTRFDAGQLVAQAQAAPVPGG